jgi:hypothetical protein
MGIEVTDAMIEAAEATLRFMDSPGTRVPGTENVDVRQLLEFALTTEPDWREMFKRYAGIVGEIEGVYYLYPCQWSEEEQAAITELLKDDAIESGPFS